MAKPLIIKMVVFLAQDPGSDGMQLLPWVATLTRYDGNFVFDNDIYAHICAIFGLNRGSIRWKFVPRVSRSNSVITGGNTTAIKDSRWFGWWAQLASGFVLVDALTTVVTDQIGQNSSTPIQVFVPDITGAIEMEFPQYSPFHSRVGLECIVNNFGGPTIGTTHASRATYNLNGGALPVSNTLASMRALGDDFSASRFVGFPPVVLTLI